MSKSILFLAVELKGDKGLLTFTSWDFWGPVEATLTDSSVAADQDESVVALVHGPGADGRAGELHGAVGYLLWLRTAGNWREGEETLQ